MNCVFKKTVVSFSHDNDHYAMFFAIDPERLDVVATAKVSPWTRGSSARPFISKVFVREDARRQGIGRELIRFIVKTCKSQGIESLAMYVHKDNHAAMDLYRSEGFRPMLDDDAEIMLCRFLRDPWPELTAQRAGE